MTGKHTPGPWHIEWSMAQGGEAHHVCDSRDMGDLSTIATVHFHDDTEGETKANARLIAAAPELLEALEAGPSTLHELPGGKECACSQCAFVRLKRAAIASATGGGS